MPAKYVVTIKDITNSGKHHCTVQTLNVTADGFALEPMQAIPSWVTPPCEECFGVYTPSEEKRPLIVEMESELDRAVLCYIECRTAFFTTQPLEKQWGDGWSRGSYEHNAEVPRSDKNGAWKIFKVMYQADLMTPADMANEKNENSYISVRDINDLTYPWLASPAESDYDCSIYAGTNFADFVKAIRSVKGEVYVKYE